MSYYVITNKENDQIFWSNHWGWVEEGEDRFTQKERDSLDLPLNGVWVYCPQVTN